MSPNDIRLNYFFDLPNRNEIEPNKYLQYSIQDDIYVEEMKESNKKINDFFQNGYFFDSNDFYKKGRQQKIQ